MALSKEEIALYAYITGRVLPRRTTRRAFNLAAAAAIKGAQTLGPPATRAAVAAAPVVGRALLNPYVAAPLAVGAAGYGAQQYFEESGIQEEVNVARDEAIAAILEEGPKISRRVKSTYNKAVSKAMKAVKASTKGGPKGKLTNAKKTFGQVSKAVSKARKGGKLSTKGVTGVIKRSISGLFTKPKPKRRTTRKGSYTVRKL